MRDLLIGTRLKLDTQLDVCGRQQRKVLAVDLLAVALLLDFYFSLLNIHTTPRIEILQLTA